MALCELPGSGAFAFRLPAAAPVTSRQSPVDPARHAPRDTRHAAALLHMVQIARL